MNPSSDPGSAPTVVIIDDDIVSATLLQRLLLAEGFKTRTATNGPQGRSLASSLQPDLVLLDVQMPDENGLECCRRLKADPRTTEIPVIFLTGSDDLATKLEGFQIGAVDYITKPYQSAEVLARIMVHIRARRALALLAQQQIAQLDRLASAQKAILPRPEQLPEARFAAVFQPIHQAGGDFYDVLKAGEAVWDYVVADVSGHDADASLVTAALKTLLVQGKATFNQPSSTLHMINATLHATFQERFYLSLAWLRLNRHRRTATLWLAGHPPVLHAPALGGLHPVGAPGDLLGMFDSIHLEETTLTVQPGDRFVLFTDGLIEWPDHNGNSSRAAGLERLMRHLDSTRAEPLDSWMASVLPGLDAHLARPEDDLLLLGLEV